MGFDLDRLYDSMGYKFKDFLFRLALASRSSSCKINFYSYKIYCPQSILLAANMNDSRYIYINNK
jgi:hypothetical protein